MLVCLFLFSPVAAAPTQSLPQPVPKVLETEVVNKETESKVAPSDTEELARQIALEEGIDVWAFVETMRGESLDFTHNGQSMIPKADGPNGYEDSWGICQIHRPSHPAVTREQALDPEWCLRWSAKKFKEGKASMWTEYKKLYTQ